MNTQQKLDPTSPIVQRVLLLRERIARQEALIVSSEGRPDAINDGKSYPWQMWQKSDLSAYAGDDAGHRCK